MQLVVEVVHFVDRLARNDPQRCRLLPPSVLLVRIRVRERDVRCLDGARVRERDAFLLLAEDFEDHAASASTTARTHASCSRNFLRNSSRSCVFGPCPVTTCLSSSQSGSLYSQTPSSLLRSFGSGTVSPSSRICGTYPSRNCWRASSFPCDLMRQCSIGSSSGGIFMPWNCISGPHQRSSASWTSSRCATVPVTIASTTSRPWRMWNDSSQQIFFMIRA